MSRVSSGGSASRQDPRCNPVETHDTLASLHPVSRIGETSDMVDVVIYLESAPFVTGEILHIDGGQSADH